MRNCAICKRNESKENGTFFRVPQCEKSRQKWSYICGKSFSPSSRLCIDHFSRSQIITAGGRYLLMPNAKPDILKLQQNEVLAEKPYKYEKLVKSATSNPTQQPFQECPELPKRMENTNVDPLQAEQTPSENPYAYEKLINSVSREPPEQLLQEYPEAVELPMELEKTNADPLQEEHTSSPISHDDVDDNITYYRNKIKILELENKNLKCQLDEANLAIDSIWKILTPSQIRQLMQKAYSLHASGKKAQKLFQPPVLDPDIIVIECEEKSDKEQSHSDEVMDEVYLEEEYEELFAKDLQQSSPPTTTTPTAQKQQQHQHQQQQQQQNQTPIVNQLLHKLSHKPEITIKKTGGIPADSIDSTANMKTLQKSRNNSTDSNNTLASPQLSDLPSGTIRFNICNPPNMKNSQNNSTDSNNTLASPRLSDLPSGTIRFNICNPPNMKTSRNNTKGSNNTLASPRLSDQGSGTIRFNICNPPNKKTLQNSRNNTKGSNNTLASPRLSDQRSGTIRFNICNPPNTKTLQNSPKNTKGSNNTLASPRLSDQRFGTIQLNIDSIANMKTGSKNTLATPRLSNLPSGTIQLSIGNIANMKTLKNSWSNTKGSNNTLATPRLSDQRSGTIQLKIGQGVSSQEKL